MTIHFNRRQRIQRGKGIGGIFSSLVRLFSPIKKIFTSPITKKIINSSIAKSIAKESVKSAAKILDSKNKKRKLKTELNNFGKKAAKFSKKSLNEILNQKLSDTESEEEEVYLKKKKKKKLSEKSKKKIKDLLDSE